MASYNADIRIGVVNSSALKKLQTQLTATQRTVDQLNQSLNFKAKATARAGNQNAQLQKEIQSQTTLQRTVERRQQAEQKLARLQKNRYTSGLAQIQRQQNRVERLKRLEMRLEEQVTEQYKRELAERLLKESLWQGKQQLARGKAKEN